MRPSRQDGARAAAALLAADVRAGQVELVPEEIREQEPGLGGAAARLAVHAHP